MALSGETNKTTFTTVGGETSFVFQIPFFDATTVTATKYGDIKVTRERSGVVNLVLTPSTTPTTQTEFKLLATNGDPSQGGTVTLGAGATAGDKYVIERDVAYTQQYDLQDGATIDPTALNKAFDRVVAQNQQQNDLLTRTVEFPVTDNTSRTYTVGTETERANKALGFDASGNVTEIDLVSSGAVSGNTNAGISISNNIISAKVDGATTEFSGGNIAVKDSGITAAKLAADSVTTAKIASTTGTDSNVVTGTKGTNGKIVIWDANGDAIDSGYTITNDDSLGTSDATLSTQGNIKSYVDFYKPNVINNYFNTTSSHTLTHNSNTFVAIPNTVTTITPKEVGSKLLVNFSISYGTANSGKYAFKIFQSIDGGAYSVVSGLPTGTGVKSHFMAEVTNDDNEKVKTVSYQVLLSPSFTLGQTVSYRLSAGVANGTSPFIIYINRSETIGGTDDSLSTSSIVIQEIYQ
jgi:hypothetical protein